jgi:hypothetical protein
MSETWWTWHSRQGKNTAKVDAGILFFMNELITAMHYVHLIKNYDRTGTFRQIFSRFRQS